MDGRTVKVGGWKDSEGAGMEGGEGGIEGMEAT